MIDAVHDATPEFLQRHGLEAVMVDLDDTLIAAREEALTGSFRAWLETLRDAGIPVLILSNGQRERVRRWSQELGVEGLALAGKPFAWAFRRGLARLGTAPHKTAMIGDQLFTDVLGANLIGLRSILVRPLSPGGLPHTRAARRLETLILRGGPRGRSFHRR